MPPADAQGQSPKFRLWLRRHPGQEGSYALRFEVSDAKGILRVSRPGVLIDPPARPMGLEERLTAPQLKTTRFILVWDGGRARQGHLLSRLEEPGLQAIEADRWHELDVLVDSGFRYLVLPAALTAPEPPKPEKARRPSLSELRQELDSLTLRSEEDEDPDSALASLTGPSPVVPTKRQPKKELTELPEPAKPTKPEAVLSPPPAVHVPDTHEVGRTGKKRGKSEDPRLDPAEARTSYYEPPAPGGGMPDSEADGESLELGEAEPGDEAMESLALGEALPGESGVMALALGAAEAGEEGGESLAMGESSGDDDEELELSSPPLPAVGDPTEAPSVPRTVSAAPDSKQGSLEQGFIDDDEEAAFSVDLPSFRKPTEHVSVLREAHDAVTALPGGKRKPVSVESLDALPDEDDEAPLAAMPSDAIPAGDDIIAGDEEIVAADEAESTSGADRVPTEPAEAGKGSRREPPWAGLPARDLLSSTTLVDEGDGDTLRGHRNSTTLVRHLRRQIEEQRHRIAELEAKIADLDDRLAAQQTHG